jgi:hypothetical protein
MPGVAIQRGQFLRPAVSDVKAHLRRSVHTRAAAEQRMEYKIWSGADCTRSCICDLDGNAYADGHLVGMFTIGATWIWIWLILGRMIVHLHLFRNGHTDGSSRVRWLCGV